VISESEQQLACEGAADPVAIPHCRIIPSHDLMELSDKLVWQAWHDPITQYPGWVELPFTLPVPNESWPQHQQRPSGFPVYLAPALQYVLQALHEAFKLKPVLIICYIPARLVPQPIWQFAQIMVDQGTGALFQAEAGLVADHQPSASPCASLASARSLSHLSTLALIWALAGSYHACLSGITYAMQVQ